MNNIAIIPARGGSKRFMRKNLALLGGVPLIAHSIAFAQKCSRIDYVFVSTDDPEISTVARDCGATVIERPAELSGDFEPTVTALQHVVQNCGLEVKNVVLLQPTNPLRPADLLINAFDLFHQSSADSLFTVSRNHHKLGKIVNDRFLPFNYVPGQRSQDLDPLYFENGLLYITKPACIMQQQIMTADAIPMIVDHPFSNVDIDTQDDLEYAQFLYNKYYR